MANLYHSIAFVFLSFTVASAGRIDTISVPSKAMQQTFNALIIRPEPSILAEKRYPVLYLLHGHSSDFAGWTYIADQLKEWADQYQMIIVCPDGDYDSWYLDSPAQPNRRFEHYLIKEFIPFIDQNYPTMRQPIMRGITGVSMGGHGAVYLSLKNPGVFGITGTISGALDLLPFSTEWNLEKLLGKKSSNEQRWKNFSVYYLLDRYCRPDLVLRIDCGTDDFFLEVNRKVHRKLLDFNVSHQYVESPGGHDIPYWTRAIEQQMRFFGMYWASKN